MHFGGVGVLRPLGFANCYSSVVASLGRDRSDLDLDFVSSGINGEVLCHHAESGINAFLIVVKHQRDGCIPVYSVYLPPCMPL